MTAITGDKSISESPVDTGGNMRRMADSTGSVARKINCPTDELRNAGTKSARTRSTNNQKNTSRINETNPTSI